MAFTCNVEFCYSAKGQQRCRIIVCRYYYCSTFAGWDGSFEVVLYLMPSTIVGGNCTGSDGQLYINSCTVDGCLGNNNATIVDSKIALRSI